ncbi:MAG: cysteine synthase A [Sphingosinicella sp.]|nr:cysteine synthase A [Sphingosinicella sp.]
MGRRASVSLAFTMPSHVSRAPAHDILKLIGGTPLVRLRGPSERTGCTILGKCEFLNPGGSVKDRAALYMIEAAEREGRLKPGGIVVEGTAGNTGIGLAVVANAKGYRTIIVMPSNQSVEKMATLRALGAELVLVPPTKYADPEHFQHRSRRIAEETPGAIWAGQFDNLANRQAHIETTAEEIWADTGGAVDGFTCAVGTGGTLAGTAMGLKAKNADIRIALTDPYGAAMYSWFARGVLESEGSSLAEGIGQGRVTPNIEGAPVDTQFRVSDEEGVRVMHDLLIEEGISLGLSSGINVVGAERLAAEMGPGHTIVTVLCDSGLRYLSSLYNPAWLSEKGLPVPDWLSAP